MISEVETVDSSDMSLVNCIQTAKQEWSHAVIFGRWASVNSWGLSKNTGLFIKSVRQLENKLHKGS
jgi:hypothetical protein